VGAADYILGSWRVNGITQIRSSQPYTVYVSGDIANAGTHSETDWYKAADFSLFRQFPIRETKVVEFRGEAPGCKSA
jgi:hypothetical protein